MDNFVPIAGSEKSFLKKGKDIGKPDPDEVIEITVFVRPCDDAASDQEEMKSVEEFAKDHNIDVIESNAEAHTIKLSGKIKDLTQAFKVDLSITEHSKGKFRTRTGTINVPKKLSDIVMGVFGLDDRPQAKPRFRMIKDESLKKKLRPLAAKEISFTTPQLAEFYDFPQKVSGKGQTIAIVSLGGGYKVADLKKYFKNLGIKYPKINWVSVDGGRNSPIGEPNSEDGENYLDIEIAGSVAPDAQIVVYFAPNTDRGFVDVISAAIHDKKYKPSIISISWGAREEQFTDQAKRVFDLLFSEASKKGISMFAAAGDNGSTDGAADKKLHVDFPASSPNITACGGTYIESDGKKITKEVVWNQDQYKSATGGGFSKFFERPEYQKKIKIQESAKGRAMPDISANADPQSGYAIYMYGQNYSSGGTSAVAPLLAGLTALFNESLKKNIGFLNPIFYNAVLKKPKLFNDITVGNNGDYKARAGWDPCTGLGTPKGNDMLSYLKS